MFTFYLFQFVVFEYEVNRLNITDNVCMFLLAYGVFWENRICVICVRQFNILNTYKANRFPGIQYRLQ